MMNKKESYRKKLIEVALPLEAINIASQKETNPFLKHHPRQMHFWWARRPLTACRAMVFALLVDDPSAWPEIFPTEETQKTERQRLFHVIEDLIKWDNSEDKNAILRAQVELARSIARSQGENMPQKVKAISKYLAQKLPPVLDPFCGRGIIPLEAQRLGLQAFASDLNPIAVLITKGLTEIPPRFAGLPPVNPKSRKDRRLFDADWSGTKGLAEDVRYYGTWMREEAERGIGHLYPKVKLRKEEGGGEAIVIAWLWARTVKCPNPVCGAHMPLVRSFALSKKRGKQAWVEPIVKGNTYQFKVRTGHGKSREGTVRNRAVHCLCCGATTGLPYIRTEAQAGRMDTVLLSIVAEGNRGPIYLPPNVEHERIAKSAIPKWKPDEKVTTPSHDVDRLPMYGMYTWGDAFTPRQLVSLTTYCELVVTAKERVLKDAIEAGMKDVDKGISDGANGAKVYAEAVSTYLAFGIGHMARYSSTLNPWNTTNQNVVQVFGRQALPMVWDFAESNTILGKLDISKTINWVANSLKLLPTEVVGTVEQLDARVASLKSNSLVVTDPPYYDNIGYADLSDFFYVWLRRSLNHIYP